MFCGVFSIMQGHIKLFVSAPPTVSGCFQGWEDLPECLLHSILPLLGSSRDFLAFAATCPSWRAAFLAYPSKSTLLTLVPPLLIQPNISVDAPHLPSNNGHCKLRRFMVIQLTVALSLAARLVNKFWRCNFLALLMVIWFSTTPAIVLLLILSVVPRFHLHVSHSEMTVRSCSVVPWIHFEIRFQSLSGSVF